MKNPVLLLFTLGLSLLLSSCGHLDLTPATNPNRVLLGTVTAGTTLPAGAEISVRLIAQPSAMEPAAGAKADLPVMARPSAPATEHVLGEFVQTLAAAASEPVPFKIDYFADEMQLRRGLNLEARVSVGGRLKFRTINAYAVTFGSASYPQNVVVQAVQ
jgi:uncharacterized lipoprotein YbaY